MAYLIRVWGAFGKDMSKPVPLLDEAKQKELLIKLQWGERLWKAMARIQANRQPVAASSAVAEARHRLFEGLATHAKMEDQLGGIISALVRVPVDGKTPLCVHAPHLIFM
jgi:hypothetical protein